MGNTDVYDFHLALEYDAEKGFTCEILRSLAGRARAQFEQFSGLSPIPKGSLRQEAEARGRLLFDSLFAGEIGEKYRRSLDRLGTGTRDGHRRSLRVRLAIDPDKEELAPLFELDWELMFDRARDRFLTRGRRTTLVRDLEVPTVLLDLPGAEVLRLLVVGAQPTAWVDLDFDAEVRLIREACGASNMKIDEMPNARWRDVKARLRGPDPVHILHFIGHGTVDEAEVEGVLIFEQPDGSEHPVSGKALAECLDDDADLRLVVLNACQTAAGPQGFPARSVAASLIKAGVPAVVAMRYQIPDASAVAFSDGFYRALVEDMDVDAAVTAARTDIDDTEELFQHWATPALFMSCLDGRIFQFAGGQEGEAMKPKFLGIRSRRHPFGELEEEYDHVLDLMPFFEGRPIRNPGDWSDKVVPYLDSFLRQHVITRRPLVLRFDAHLTVSFAAGWLIDTRGIDVTIRQALMGGGFQDWHQEFDRPYEGPLWKTCEVERKAAGNEVAVAVGITNDALDPVTAYVERHLSDRVSRILAMTPDPVPSNTAVRDANHAFALAQDLKRRIDTRDEKEEEGPLHLFFAAPGCFTFYLGQLARGFGEIQLYEWEFEKRGSKTYQPSLRITPDEGGRR